MTIEILKKAIQQKSVISFEYNKPGKVTGKRIGNPHAVFIMRTSDGTESTLVHIVQTSGVSDSQQTCPSFRAFSIENLSNVIICVPVVTFEESPQYNSEWDGYKSVIAKV